MTDKSNVDRLLLTWERAIVTQMHFAELSIKTRQIGMTVVGATLGLAVVLNRTDTAYRLSFACFTLPITAVLCWAAAAVLGAIWLLDVGVYHRMLRGAVAFNEELEEKHLRSLFGTEKGLTQAISFYSRHTDASYSDGKYFRTHEHTRHYAGNRITHFYVVMIIVLVVAGLAMVFAGVK